jgi:hypothetical protein
MPMRRREKSRGRVTDTRPVDWWRAGVWTTRAARETRAAKRLKRADTNAEKNEVSPKAAPGKSPPRR